MINRQDVIDWLESPVTLAYFEGVKFKVRELEKALGRGTTLNDDNPHSTIVATAKMIGQIEGHKDDIDVDISAVIEIEES